MTRAGSTVFTLVAALASAASAQRTGSPATSQVVTIDFSAHGPGGSPVLDLAPSDLRIRIGADVRPVQSLRRVTIDGPAAPAGLPPPFASSMPDDPPHRTLVFVFDDESMRPGREQAFRAAAAHLLGSLSPADRVAVATLPLGGIRLDLTTDHRRARAIMDGLGGKAPRSHDASAFACRSRRTLETLAELLESVAGVRGPTMVIFISSSLSGPTRDTAGRPPDSIGPGMCEIDTEKFEAVAIAAARARANVQVVQPEDPMVTLGNVTPGALAGRSMTALTAGLEHLAGVTGGRLLRLGESAAVTVERILEGAGDYYVATVAALPSDQGVARLAITTTREGVMIRARPRVALHERDAIARRAITPREMLRHPRTYGEFGLRAAGYVSSNPGDARLRVIAIAEAEDGAAMTAAAIGLFDSGGRLVAQWTARPEELAAAPLTAAMAASPGRYRMRVAARDGHGRAATVDYDLDARLEAAGDVRISSLVLGLSRAGSFHPRLLFTDEPTVLAQVELTGVPPGPWPSGRLEIARSANGEALASLPGAVAPSGDPGRGTLSGVIPIGALPPGDYVIRVIVTSATGSGRVLRTLRKRQHH